jgi:hypothetical protein
MNGFFRSVMISKALQRFNACQLYQKSVLSQGNEFVIHWSTID